MSDLEEDREKFLESLERFQEDQNQSFKSLMSWEFDRLQERRTRFMDLVQTKSQGIKDLGNALRAMVDTTEKLCERLYAQTEERCGKLVDLAIASAARQISQKKEDPK